MHWAAATAAAAAAAAAAAMGKARANRCDSNMLTYEADWGVIRASAWTVQIPLILNQEQHPFMSDFEQHAGIVDTGVRMTHHVPFYERGARSSEKTLFENEKKKVYPSDIVYPWPQPRPRPQPRARPWS